MVAGFRKRKRKKEKGKRKKGGVSLKAGEWLDGRYRIIRSLGKGSEGSVYLAVRESTYKFYAVKELSKSGEFFSEESIALWKRLSHPGLPEIADVLEKDEKIYLIMDYIEGSTLEEVIAQRGVPAIHTVLLWGIRICEILAYLHGQNPPVIFGDVKPSNLVLRKDEVMLVDLGSAAMLCSRGLKSGTEGYFPPWKCRTGAEAADLSVDIYGLGKTLEFLASGGGKRKRLPKEFKRILAACTAEKGYRSAGECRKALERLRFRRQGLSVAVLFALCVAAAAGHTVRMEQRAADTAVRYGELLAQAKNSAAQERRTFLLEAIALDASCETGYLKLLDVFLEDGKLSEEEDVCLRMTLKEIGPEGKSREEMLLENRSGYLEVAYEVGIAYWYFYEGESAKAYAGSWFEKAAQMPEGEVPDKSRFLRSRIYGRIGEYRGKLMKSGKTGEEQISYKEYWQDLMELFHIPPGEPDSPVVILHIWRELLLQMSHYMLEFQSAGVTHQEMREVIAEIGRRTDEIREEGQAVKEEKEEITELQKILGETLEGMEEVYEADTNVAGDDDLAGNASERQ